MPKEQPCLSKHNLCATSSKNAKDRSNSTTLLAIQNTEDTVKSNGRGSHCSSEKDSGYSDGSDWQHTDAEDPQSNKSQSRGNEHAETSVPRQNQEPGQQCLVNSTLMPAGHELSPIYIINNMMLKQPDKIQKNIQLPRRNGSREASRSDAARMILLQQPSLLLATLQLHKPSSQKARAPGKVINGTYLPILNSYPRIAPHPSKKTPDNSSSNDESLNVSKRACPQHKSDDTSMTKSPSEQHLYKQPKLAVLTSGLPCSSSVSDDLSLSSPTAVSPSQGSTSGSSMCTNSSFLSTKALHRSGGISTRHRRFLNTVEILRKSGLLDITLSTKELLRQSNATDRDIAQLRQHTELLCQAASNPSIAALEHVHRTMAESGSYPYLENVQIPCHPDSASQTESISTGDARGSLPAATSEFPSSHFLRSIWEPNQDCPVPHQSHSGQVRVVRAGSASPEKVTFVPPDSSTG